MPLITPVPIKVGAVKTALNVPSLLLVKLPIEPLVAVKVKVTPVLEVRLLP